MFNELTKQIDGLLTEKPSVIVGISGFAGAGKTHLADKLRGHYDVSDGQVVHLDNLYMPLPRGTGFKGEPYYFSETLPKVLLVEGIRLYRPEFMDNFDLSIWIDCPPELALRRAKERDLSQGHNEAYMKRWIASGVRKIRSISTPITPIK
jgi:uridine kinase